MAALKMSQDIINHLLAVIMNFTDLHDSFCLACSDLGMVQILIDMTKDLQDTISYHVKYVVSLINSCMCFKSLQDSLHEHFCFSFFIPCNMNL